MSDISPLVALVRAREEEQQQRTDQAERQRRRTEIATFGAWAVRGDHKDYARLWGPDDVTGEAAAAVLIPRWKAFIVALRQAFAVASPPCHWPPDPATWRGKHTPECVAAAREIVGLALAEDWAGLGDAVARCWDRGVWRELDQPLIYCMRHLMSPPYPELRDAVPHAPGGPPSRTKQRVWTKDEADAAVSEYLRDHKARAAKGDISIREINREAGVPIASAQGTTAWTAYQARLEKLGLSRRPRRKAAQALPGNMDETLAANDATIRELVGEQTTDDQESAAGKGRRGKVRVRKQF